MLLETDIKSWYSTVLRVLQLTTLFLISFSDDSRRIRSGISNPQRYHAFLLYADEDFDFATLIIKKLEKEYRLKVQKRRQNKMLRGLI